jgi:hypothetical protein
LGLLLLAARVAAMENPAEAPPPAVTGDTSVVTATPSPRTIRAFDAYNPVVSTSGRFVALGPRTDENLIAVRWAEQWARKMEKLSGLRLAGDRRVIRIVIQPPPQALPAGASGPALGGEPDCTRVKLTQYVDGARLAQRIEIPGLNCLYGEEGEAAFCRLLFCDARIAPSNFPLWLAVGMVRNLTVERRDESCRLVLDQWRRGGLAPLAQWLGSAETRGAGAEGADRAMCGMLAAWMLQLPDRSQKLQAIVERLAQQRTVTADWFATTLFGLQRAADLDSAWDDWLLGQRRVVRLPGRVTPDLVDRMKAELLLYPGDFGIPLKDEPNHPVAWQSLIEERGASWVKVLACTKAGSLRMLAAGRGKDVGETVEFYCRFLDALARGKSRARLQKLLREAERSLAIFEEQHRVSEPAGAGRDGGSVR